MATSTLDLASEADAFVAGLGPSPRPPAPPRHPLADSTSPEFKALAAQYKLDPALMGRLMQAESGGKPGVTSPKGAKGLFQLMDAVQQDYGVTDPMDPAQNVPAAMQYMRDLLKQHGGDSTLALAAWNAGPQNVKKYGGVPPFAETQGLIGKVLGRDVGNKLALGQVADDFVQSLQGLPAGPREPGPGLPPFATPTQRRQVPGERPEPYPNVAVTPPQAPVPPAALRFQTDLQALGGEFALPSSFLADAAEPAEDLRGAPLTPGPLRPGLYGPPTPTRAERMYSQMATTAREAGLPPPAPPDLPLQPGLGGGYLQAAQIGLRQGAAGIAHQLRNLFMLANKGKGVLTGDTPEGQTADANWLAKGQQIMEKVEASLRVNPDVLKEPKGLDTAIVQAIGEAAPHVAEFLVTKGVLGGPLAMAAPGALGAADQGIAASAWEAMKGFAMSGYLHAASTLPRWLRVPAVGGLLGAGTYAETGDPQAAKVQALVGGVLALPGGPGRPLREQYQSFSDWVDQTTAAKQAQTTARQSGRQGPSSDDLFADGMRWHQEGLSRANVAANFRSKYGMDAATAREASERTFWAHWEAVNQRMGGAAEEPPGEAPPAGGPTPSPPGAGPRPRRPRPTPPPAGAAPGTPPSEEVPPPGGLGATSGAAPPPEPPPVETPQAPIVPPPRPGAVLTKEKGTLYTSKARAEFAMEHRADVSDATHVVVEDPPGSWYILPKEQLHAAEGKTPVQRLADLGEQQALTPDEDQWIVHILRQGDGIPAFTPEEPRGLPPGRQDRARVEPPSPARPDVIPLPGTPEPLELPPGRIRPALREAPARPGVLALGPSASVAPRLERLVSNIETLTKTMGQGTLAANDAEQAISMLKRLGQKALTHYGAEPPTPVQPLLKRLRAGLKALDAHWDTLHPETPSATTPPLPGSPESPENLPPSEAQPHLWNDPVYQQAVYLVKTHQRASGTWLAQQMKLPFSQAEALLKRMEADKIVSPAAYPQPRQVMPAVVPAVPPAPPTAIEALFGEEPPAGLRQGAQEKAPPTLGPTAGPRVPTSGAPQGAPPELPAADLPTYQVGDVVTIADPTTGQPTQGTVARPFAPGGPDTRVTVRVQGAGFVPPRTVFVEPGAVQRGGTTGTANPPVPPSVAPTPGPPVGTPAAAPALALALAPAPAPPPPAVTSAPPAAPPGAAPVPPASEAPRVPTRLEHAHDQLMATYFTPGALLPTPTSGVFHKVIAWDSVKKEVRVVPVDARGVPTAQGEERGHSVIPDDETMRRRIAQRTGGPSATPQVPVSASPLAAPPSVPEVAGPVAPAVPPQVPAPVPAPETVSPETSSALPPNSSRPDFAAGIPIGRQVSLVRPTAEDAQALLTRLETGLADDRMLHKWSVLERDEVLPRLEANREHLAQYLQEMEEMPSKLRAQLKGMDTRLARFSTGVEALTPEEQGQTFLKSIERLAKASSLSNEDKERIGHRLVQQTEDVLQSGVDAPLYDRLMKALVPCKKSLVSPETPAQSAMPQVEVEASPETPPVPAPKTLRSPRITKAEREAQVRADLLRTYFTPGVVVRSSGGGFDKVLSFDPGTELARVIGTDPQGTPLRGEVERVHHTIPDDRTMRVRIAQRSGKPPTPPE